MISIQPSECRINFVTVKMSGEIATLMASSNITGNMMRPEADIVALDDSLCMVIIMCSEIRYYSLQLVIRHSPSSLLNSEI